MENLLNQISDDLKQELSSLNPKISGSVLLEILKYKIIDKLRDFPDKNSFKNIENTSKQVFIDNELNKIDIKINFYKSSLSNLNIEAKNDVLFICLNKFINITINTNDKNKNFSYKCLPITGVVLNKGSIYSLSYSKDSLAIEINLEDKIKDIEIKQENTI